MSTFGMLSFFSSLLLSQETKINRGQDKDETKVMRQKWRETKQEGFTLHWIARCRFQGIDNILLLQHWPATSCTKAKGKVQQV
jgi:hypothetical protein